MMNTGKQKEEAKKERTPMKFRKIGIKLLAFILPVVIIAMAALTGISVKSGSNTIESQISARMSVELAEKQQEMGEYLDSVSNMATTIARVVTTSYRDMKMSAYEDMLAEIIQDNSIVNGSGLWFEPYAYDSSKEFMGPYIYKDGDSIKVTYDYSNADYDYFNQDYYLKAKEAQGAIFTDPYYDDVSGTIMSTCAMPLLDNGKYIGCVTVDIQLGTLTDLVNAIQVGETGRGLMVTGEGVYMAGTTEENLAASLNIKEDTNTSLALAAETMLAGQDGSLTYQDEDGEQNLYYITMPQTGWKLAIIISQSELSQPVRQLFAQLLVVCIVGILLASGMILVQVGSISKNLKKVQGFAGSLAEGDFTVDALAVKSEDELGSMGKSLNTMYESNKNMISSISEHAVHIDDSSKLLNKASEELVKQFEDIQKFMVKVNEAMMTTGASTEEVNASTEEVLSNVNLLAGATEESMNMAGEIRTRANEIGNTSQKAFDSAQNLSKQFEGRLEQSIKNAEVVSEIAEMANVISNIAEQIDLLSLNASIEAARAGEAGRGFAVVATEIGNLAKNTTEAIGRIQETVEGVQAAFGGLSEDAKGMLAFLQDTVTPDYNSFIGVANQYEKDADSVAETSAKISEMSDNIKTIMNQVTEAIQSIAEATQDTSDVSTKVLGAVEDVSGEVQRISEMSQKQQDIAEDLNSVVGKFKL